MKKIVATLLVALLITWPPRLSSAKENITDTLINYQLTKYDVITYQINKKIVKIEKFIDSVKKQKQEK